MITKQQRAEFMSSGEIAELIGVSSKTILRWSEAGTFPKAYRLNRRTFRWRRTEVLQHIESTQVEEPAILTFDGVTR